MSSSYLKVASRAGMALVCVVLGAGSAQAAQYFWVPEVELTAEANTNRDMDPVDKDSSELYSAMLAATLGVATPRGETAIRPQVHFLHYPDQSAAKDVEGGVDITSVYDSPLSSFTLFGRAERRDVYNAELADPRFNELDPNNPTAPESGRIIGVGETRDLLLFRPDYSHHVTERLDLGVHGVYQKLDYGSDRPTATVDFDYANAGLYGGWEFSQRLTTAFEVYGARYRTGDDSRKADSTGVSLTFEYRWSETFNAEFAVIGERTEVDDILPVRNEDTVTSVGGRFALAHRAPISETRIEISHLVMPTGAGGMFESDILQLQFDRKLSERLTFRSSAYYNRNRALSDVDQSGDSDYANAEIALSWSVTRTWYVFGGYRYIWEEYDQVQQSAHNNAVFAGVGYRGLGRQR
jgi:hypothetical protein